MTPLSSSYLGIELASPLVVAASPLSHCVDTMRRAEASGAGAIVVFSLFEQQFEGAASHTWKVEPRTQDRTQELFANSKNSEHDTFFSSANDYVAHLSELKRALSIPVFGSLSVSRMTPGLVEFAERMEAAGVDAIELNLCRVRPTSGMTGAAIEESYVHMVSTLTSAVTIPLSIKLLPFFTDIVGMSGRLTQAGGRGLVLFNRMYQPRIDVARRRIVTDLHLSDSKDAGLPTLWIGRVGEQIDTDLAAVGGMHTVADTVGALMAGANVVMFCSALLRHGVEHLQYVRSGLEQWLEEQGHDSVTNIRATMGAIALESAEEYTRRGYSKILNRSW